MSGHSKWATIKHKKGLADAKRGQKFTKLIKEITVAAKMGGGDPDSNARLRTAILKARAENMPKDNIERAIKKASGEDANTTFYELTYEGYAPGGVAIIIDTLTDNKNRTAADVRSTLTKLGGSLGATGCVSYMFQTKGVITYDASKYTEDQIFEAALENGAEDVSADDGVIEVTTSPSDFAAVLEAMQAAGFEQDSADVNKIADNTYYGNQPNNLEVGSIGNGGSMEAGIVFHLNNDARLNGISVGFGQEDEMSAVVLNVYKWYEKEPTASGFHPLSESDLVYTTAVDKEYGTGQFKYAIDDDVNLPAGDYLISARVSTGWPLAVDRKAPGQLYSIGNHDEGFVAVDQRNSNLGTMAIRAILGEGGGASISTVEGGTSLSLNPNPASETLTITAGEGEITSVAIYSTLGSVMCSSKVQGNSFSCNVSSYTPGIYFAKVTANGKTEVLKFVVK